MVAARNQVCLHMEVYGSGMKKGSSGGPGGASPAALHSPSGRLLTGPDVCFDKACFPVVCVLVSFGCSNRQLQHCSASQQ